MAKKEGPMGLYHWLRQDTTLGYIINSYIGVEEIPGRGTMRRVFVWERDGAKVKGNTEAFMLHLGERFQRKVGKWDASYIHELLRDLGDAITPHSKHDKPDPKSPRAGQFKQPEPDEWIVRPSNK